MNPIINWEVFVVPRKSELKLTEATNSSNAAAKTVTSKYGFLAYRTGNIVGDGMNEKGLAIATQTLYQSASCTLLLFGGFFSNVLTKFTASVTVTIRVHLLLAVLTP